VAVDLDGTLLDESRQVGAQTAEAIRGLAAGREVVIASARPPRSVRPIYELLRLDTWQINYNGAMIWDERNRRTVFHLPMKGDLVRRIIGEARRFQPEVLVSCEILDAGTRPLRRVPHHRDGEALPARRDRAWRPSPARTSRSSSS